MNVSYKKLWKLLIDRDLKSTARQQKIAHARHSAIYLAREILNLSYESIGEFFDKKHTTIMYSCNNVLVWKKGIIFPKLLLQHNNHIFQIYLS